MQSPTPRQSTAHPSHTQSPSFASTSTTSSLPYSQPIPRPHRTRNDTVQQLHRGSSFSGHSSNSGPSSTHFPRSSGSPPLPSIGGRLSGTRRQSGLRSSIVSADLEWEKGIEEGHDGPRDSVADENHLFGDDGRISLGSGAHHGHSSFGDGRGFSGDYEGSHYPNDEDVSAYALGSSPHGLRSVSPGPSSSSYQSAIRPGSSFLASRPPSSYQDSGRGSGYGFNGDSSFLHSPMTADTSVAHSVTSSPEVGKRAPSLHSKTSRSNMQQFPGINSSGGLMRTPSGGGGLGLARSPSSGSLMNGRPGMRSPGRVLSRTTSATALNASARSASSTSLHGMTKGPGPGLSRSNSYSARSMPHPHGKLEISPRSIVADFVPPYRLARTSCPTFTASRAFHRGNSRYARGDGRNDRPTSSLVQGG